MASPEAVWLVDGKAGCERAGSSLGCVGSACVYVKGEERGAMRRGVKLQFSSQAGG